MYPDFVVSFLKIISAMEANFTWKTKFFSNNYQIFKTDQQIGELLNKAFSRSSTGTLNGKTLVFDVHGLFRSETKILDENEAVVAEVDISTWKSNATIHYKGKDYVWQHENFWHTKWSVGNENGALVKYHTRSAGGEILSYTDDPVLIMAGLFIKNYFRQRAASAAAASS